MVVALDFTPNPAHSPIFLAAREGFDRSYGVRISIRIPGSAPDALKLLAAGRTDLQSEKARRCRKIRNRTCCTSG